MELQSALNRFVADELQHFEVFIALGIRQRNRANVIPWHCQEKRISEMKIGVGDVGRKIVADAEREAKAIKPLSRKFSQVGLPEGAIVEPGFVLDIAVERASDAADFVGRPLNNAFDGAQIFQRVLGEANAIGELKHAVNEAANVGAAG